jgi:isopenicillin-N epimerase
LYARPQQQHLIEPVLVSWGWGEHRNVTYGSDFLDYLQWTGTNDPAAYLSVPAAIAFQEEHNWTAVRQQCHQLLSETIQRLCDLTGLAPRYSQDSLYAQLAIAPLPAATDIPDLKTQLYDQFRVEVPCFQWQDQKFIRVSVQGYNTQADLDTLIEAVSVLLSR